MSWSYSWDYSNSYAYLDRVRQGFPPLIITCAINGGIQGKEAHPALPETPNEIADEAYEAYNAGACMVHIHARNPSNLADMAEGPEPFKEANALVREKCPDIIINNTTGGGPTTTMEQRLQFLDAMPEAASLNMGPDMSRLKIAPRPDPLLHPHDGFVYDDCIPFTYGFIEQLASRMKERGIKPEMEMYNPGHYWVSQHLIKKNLISPPYLFQFVMGYQTSIFGTPENLISMVRELPEDSIFFALGIGPLQLPMTTTALLLGGHVRVGLEDNLYARRGVRLKGNGEAVERVVEIARALNRDIATPQQAREMLGFSLQPSRY